MYVIERAHEEFLGPIEQVSTLEGRKIREFAETCFSRNVKIYIAQFLRLALSTRSGIPVECDKPAPI
jgi:hypothetical protein